MTALSNIMLDTGVYQSNLSLQQELRRQPWLSEEERIAFAVEAATEFMLTQDECDEKANKSFDEGKDEGITEGRDALADELRAIVDHCDAQDMPPDQVLAALLKEFY